MDVLDLKEYVLNEKFIVEILESIGCHSIKYHDGNPDDYYTCANPDGDKKTAITVYENEYLTTLNYTRNITNKSGVSPDLITLVEYILDVSFFDAFKHICGVVGLEVYHNFEHELPESLRVTKMLDKMNSGHHEDDVEIRVVDESILKYYKPYVNDMFKDDGISYKTQAEFEVGYDEMTNRITIPIRSEFGDLVGVKGRVFDYDYKGDFKYMYLKRCPRNQILYGLYKTIDHIRSEGFVYVVESEKGVMQLWDMGIKNVIGIGGKMISQSQIDKIDRLGVEVILAFDKDVEQEELEILADKFFFDIPVRAVIDIDGILDEHESPTDNVEKWNILTQNNLYELR